MNFPDYNISERVGFLMQQPQEKLPQLFDEWNDLAANTPELTVSKTLRTKVEQMPILNHEELTSYNDLRLAHLQLSIIAAGYIWQNGDQGVPQRLPKSVAIPWYRVSQKLGLKPILCHADLVLANWKLKDPAGALCLELYQILEKKFKFELCSEVMTIEQNLQCIYKSLPGAQEAEWFIIVTAQIEIDFATALKHINNVMNAAAEEDKAVFIENMEGVESAVRKMQKSLSRMHEKLSAETFYNIMRPFLSGWGGPSSALPEGLIYEGINIAPEQMIGGSAAQSSSLQCIDATFTIKHSEDVRAFLRKMRDYMPPEHRRFIEEIEQTTLVRKYVHDCGDEELTSAYNRVLESVIDFRSYHIQIITKYIIIMSSQENRSRDYESLAKQGTGGSSILPFLKSIRDATKESLICNND